MGKLETIGVISILGIGGISAYYILKGIGNFPSLDFPKFDLKLPFWKNKLEVELPKVKSDLDNASLLQNQITNKIMLENEKQAEIIKQLAELESDFNEMDVDIVRLNNEIQGLEATIEKTVQSLNEEYNPLIAQKEADYNTKSIELDNAINTYNREVYLRDNPKVELGINVYNPLALSYYITRKNQIIDQNQGIVNSKTVEKSNAKIAWDNSINIKEEQLNFQTIKMNQDLIAKREIVAIRVIAQDEIKKMIDSLRSEVNGKS